MPSRYAKASKALEFPKKGDGVFWSSSLKLISEETTYLKEAGALPVRRRSVLLFSYKYYADQEPLLLEEDDLMDLRSAITQPPPENPEIRTMASKILTKVAPNI